MPGGSFIGRKVKWHYRWRLRRDAMK